MSGGVSTAQAGGEPLELTVSALRDELAGLRASAQLRAVIEQAKGVLMEREGISADEAFRQLRRLSQEHNARLVEVASMVVALASPEQATISPGAVDVLTGRIPASRAPSPAWRALQSSVEVRDRVAAAVLDSVAGATADGDEAARLLADVLAGHDVARVALYRTELDGALRLVGQVGVPADVISAWRTMPPSRELPMVRAALDRRALFHVDRATRVRQFPAVAGVAAWYGASAAIPVVLDPPDGPVGGVVGLSWDEARRFTDAQRDAICAAALRVARLALPQVRPRDPELWWLTALQALHLDPWLVVQVVRDDTGRAVKLRVVDAAPDLTDAPDWLGRRLLELWPDLAADGTWTTLIGLARTGGLWTTTVTAPSDAPWGTPGTRVRALRLGRYIVLVWRRLGR